MEIEASGLGDIGYENGDLKETMGNWCKFETRATHFLGGLWYLNRANPIERIMQLEVGNSCTGKESDSNRFRERKRTRRGK